MPDNSKNEQTPVPPVAARKDTVHRIHGDERSDPYYWLNQREDQEVLDYLHAENAYKENVLAHTSKLQEDLFAEITGRIAQNDESVPYFDNGYYYYTKYEEGQEYRLMCRKRSSLDGQEEIYLNENELAEPFDFYRIGATAISPDNNYVGYGEDTLSRRIYNIRFKNLETGEYLDDVIENTTGSLVWSADGKSVFYARKDKTLRPYQIYRHNIGDPAYADKLVHEEKDETYNSYVYKSRSDQYIIIGSFSTLSSEYKILSADNPEGEFKVFTTRRRPHEYYIDHAGDRWYIMSNDNAENFKLMLAEENNTDESAWTEILPHREDVLLEDIDCFRDFMVVSERVNGQKELRVMPYQGKDFYVAWEDEAYVTSMSTNRDFNPDFIRVNFSSLTTPNSVYDYDLSTGKKTLKKQQEVVGDFKSSDYASERIMIPARDGTPVPVSLVYKKGFKKNASHPLLLYGYGSYGSSMNPYFSSVRLSLLDRGWVFAIAHIRGGQEMGRRWYEDGKLLNKKNTFTDFIDVGKGLVVQKYCADDKLFAMGGSAGGLLMGAIINMEPDMWAGVVAAVPFVDVVTTMLDESIPLTTGEFDEWGNPKDETYYNYIKSYSPYDNIEAKDYPPLLVTTGLHDSQVQYWEPAKWVARLRHLKTDKNPLLLHTDMTSGHGGASGRFARYKDTALEYAFLIDLAE